MFNKKDALNFAKLSQLAYSESSLSVNNNSMIFREDTESQTLVFRGSNDLKDFISDASVFLVYRGKYESKVHNGFADSYEDLYTVFSAKLDKKKKLFISGHSLGASMAALCAADLKRQGYNVQPVYTYGQPRVGDSNWKKFFDKIGVELYRVVNGTDIVTKIPILFVYHVGTPVYLDGGKIVDKEPSAFTFFFWKRKKDIDNHETISYIKSLEVIQDDL